MARLFNPFYVAVDGNGIVMPFAKMQFYQTGTTTPLDTYTSSSLGTPNANPVVADINGLFPPIYLQTTTDYKAVLMTSASVVVATLDPLLTTKPITTRGDLIVGGVGGIDQRLAIGTSGQVLGSDGTDAVWVSQVSAATQAQQETGSVTNVYVSPGRQQFHDSAAKAWIMWGTSGSIADSFNVTSVTDTGVGDQIVTIATDFSDDRAVGLVCVRNDVTTTVPAGMIVGCVGQTGTNAGAFRMITWRLSDYAFTDPGNYFYLAAFGDQ